MAATSSSQFADESETGTGSDSDSESDSNNESSRYSHKRMKLSGRRTKIGAAVYKTKFNHAWTKTYSFIREVKGDQYKFLCTVCGRNVSCSHQGKRDVERHVGKAMHKANAKGLKTQSVLNFHPLTSPVAEKVTRFMCSVSLTYMTYSSLLDHTSRSQSG